MTALAKCTSQPAHVQQPANAPLPAGLPRSKAHRSWLFPWSLKRLLVLFSTVGLSVLLAFAVGFGTRYLLLEV